MRAERSMVTARSAEWYERVFGNFGGKSVLDLGSGGSTYDTPNRVRFDVTYAKTAPSVGTNVAGLFQQLPFRDESFEAVTASWSFIKLKEGARLALTEALRVNRPDGQILIYPAKVKSKHLAQDLETSGTTTLVRPPGTTISRPRVAASGGIAAGGIAALGKVNDIIGGVGLLSKTEELEALCLAGATIMDVVHPKRNKVLTVNRPHSFRSSTPTTLRRAATLCLQFYSPRSPFVEFHLLK